VRSEKSSKIRSLGWINTGFFIYFSSNLLLYYFGDQLMNALFPKELGRWIWILHVFFMTLMHICFFIGLWKSPKR
jgi:hypothetical protein